MINFGAQIARGLQTPATIELVGDVGAGKTTLVKGIARELGITDPVTSPSFTISKIYQSPKLSTVLAHFDFYRLSEPGLMSGQLTEHLAEPGTITVIEWSDSVADILPKNRTTITISLNPDGSRKIEVTS